MATSWRKKFITECKVEKGKRIAVWKGTVIPRENKVSFASLEHERRYNELDMLQRMLEAMTEAEVNRFVDRALLAESPVQQTDLFT